MANATSSVSSVNQVKSKFSTKTRWPEIVIVADVVKSDLTTFKNTTFAAAIGTNMKVTGANIKVKLGSYKVLVTYLLPNAGGQNNAKTAISVAISSLLCPACDFSKDSYPVPEADVEVEVSGQVYKVKIRCATMQKAQNVTKFVSDVTTLKMVFGSSFIKVVVPVVKVAPSMSVTVETRVVAVPGTDIPNGDALGRIRVPTGVQVEVIGALLDGECTVISIVKPEPEILISSQVEMSDLGTFEQTKFASATSKAMGVDDSNLLVKVTGYRISVSYELPSSVNITKVQATAAIASANRVPASDVEVCLGTFAPTACLPGASRRLAPKNSVSVRMQFSDAAVAETVKASTSDLTELRIAFTNVQPPAAVSPVLKVGPSAFVQVETKVVSNPGTLVSSPYKLELVQAPNAAQLVSIGASVGGTVSLKSVFVPPPLEAPTTTSNIDIQTTLGPAGAGANSTPSPSPAVLNVTSVNTARIKTKGAASPSTADAGMMGLGMAVEAALMGGILFLLIFVVICFCRRRGRQSQPQPTTNHSLYEKASGQSKTSTKSQGKTKAKTRSRSCCCGGEEGEAEEEEDMDHDHSSHDPVCRGSQIEHPFIEPAQNTDGHGQSGSSFLDLDAVHVSVHGGQPVDPTAEANHQAEHTFCGSFSERPEEPTQFLKKHPFLKRHEGSAGLEEALHELPEDPETLDSVALTEHWREVDGEHTEAALGDSAPSEACERAEQMLAAEKLAEENLEVIRGSQIEAPKPPPESSCWACCRRPDAPEQTIIHD